MPTVCKIMLDATDYRKELQTVLAESRAASAALGNSYASASASAQDLADSIGTIPGNKTVAVTADVSQAKAALSDLTDKADLSDKTVAVTADVSQAEAALSDLTDKADLSDKTVAVTADVSQAKAALSDLSDLSDKTVKPVSISVIADTVKIAELKAQIAKLEDKEIKAQVKVVDDQIALLQKELDAIQNKDITVTTQADLEQAEKLKAVIAALQNKKIQIRTEVHSEKLDNLRDQLQKTQSGAGKFSMAFNNLIPQGFGAQIKTGAAAVSAFGAAAGASVPPVGLLAAAVNLLLHPIALVMAALAGLAAVGMAVWDKLTISAEEYAEKTKAASEEAQRQAEKIKDQDQAAQGYITRLQEIAAAETAGNAAKTETVQLLSILESQYGNLGAVIDETTGKIVNMAEVEERVNAARNQKLADARYKQSEAQMNEAKAAYMKIKGSEWFSTEAGAGRYFDEIRKIMSPEQILKIMEGRASNATTQDEITGYNEVVSKLRAAIETRNKARQINATGYETKEEYQSAMANKSRQVGQAQAANIQLDRAASRRQADNALTFIRDSDAKISNRQVLIDEEKKRQTGIQKEIDQAKKDVDTADTAEKKLDAQKRLLDAQAQYKRSQASIVELEQQIAQIKYNQAEAKRKLNDPLKFELEYNRLIASGEYDKAAALKLEYNLKQQNLKLSENEKKELLEMQKIIADQKATKSLKDPLKFELEYNRLIASSEYDKAAALKLEYDLRQQNLKLSENEKKELLEQQKIIAGQKLTKSLKDQAFSLYGQAMEKAGRGKEFAEERALREARETKGRDLTSDEIDKIKKLSEISYKMANQRSPQAADLSIKTNSLTARGGFAGGVRLPDTEKIAREACGYNRRQAETAERIKQLLEDWGR